MLTAAAKSPQRSCGTICSLSARHCQRRRSVGGVTRDHSHARGFFSSSPFPFVALLLVFVSFHCFCLSQSSFGDFIRPLCLSIAYASLHMWAFCLPSFFRSFSSGLGEFLRPLCLSLANASNRYVLYCLHTLNHASTTTCACMIHAQCFSVLTDCGSLCFPPVALCLSLALSRFASTRLSCLVFLASLTWHCLYSLSSLWTTMLCALLILPLTLLLFRVPLFSFSKFSKCRWKRC